MVLQLNNMNERGGNPRGLSSVEMGADMKERKKFVESSTVQDGNKKTESGGKKCCN